MFDFFDFKFDPLSQINRSATIMANRHSQRSAKNAPSREYRVPSKEFFWQPGKDPTTPAAIERFFNSPKIRALKRLIVDLGKRSYGRNFNDGNGGNFTVRVGDNLVLCTPTMISKGSMTEADMCLVDLCGNQLAGNRRRTSEALAHLAIMRRQPLAKACCHAHPPHATAFALAGLTPPRCVNPETEIFIGQVALAEYGTPGTSAMAEAVGEAGKDHDCVFMENHGVMTWAGDVETALWKMENIEAHCYTCMLASLLGGVKRFSEEKASELTAMRSALNFVRQPDFCNFGSGRAPLSPEALVQAVSERVLSALSGQLKSDARAQKGGLSKKKAKGA